MFAGDVWLPELTRMRRTGIFQRLSCIVTEGLAMFRAVDAVKHSELTLCNNLVSSPLQNRPNHIT